MSAFSVQPYDTYLPTGIEWLSEVPSSWKISEAKRVFSSRREASRTDDGQLAVSQQYGVIPQSLMMRMNDARVMLALQGTSSFRHVERGDFVISLRSFEGGIEYSAYKGCVSPAYTVLAARNEVISQYYTRLLKSEPFVAALQSTTDSLRDGKSISFSQFGRLWLPVPPLEEQTQIAKFLDYETAKIDALIAKQQQLIALLQEKRQAVINHAVTKGLNPDAPLRDSGVEWLGKVPAHWVIVPLKRFIEFQRGHDLPTEERREGNYPVVSSAGPIGTHDDYRCKGPGIVTGRYGTIGEFYYVPKDFWPLNTALYSINCHGNDERFLLYMLRNMKHIFVLNSLKAAVPGVDRNDVHSEYVAAPQKPQEQQAIAKYLDDRMSRFDDLTRIAEAAVELLQERRTALISAAVTGKIDVRGWQPPLANPAEGFEA